MALSSQLGATGLCTFSIRVRSPKPNGGDVLLPGIVAPGTAETAENERPFHSAGCSSTAPPRKTAEGELRHILKTHPLAGRRHPCAGFKTPQSDCRSSAHTNDISLQPDCTSLQIQPVPQRAASMQTVLPSTGSSATLRPYDMIPAKRRVDSVSRAYIDDRRTAYKSYQDSIVAEAFSPVPRSRVLRAVVLSDELPDIASLEAQIEFETVGGGEDVAGC